MLELDLVGCPDPNPRYRRFFAPERNGLPADTDAIGARYVGRVAEELDRWLDTIPGDAPIGVPFSGGIDSGAVLLLLNHLLLRRGEAPARMSGCRPASTFAGWRVTPTRSTMYSRTAWSM